MKFRRLAMIVALTLIVAACANAGGPKQIGGGLLGGGLGALAGSQIGSGRGQLAAVGTLLGALLGSEAGKSLDRADQLFMQQAMQRGLETAPSGSTSSWVNPDNGNSGTFTPTRTFQTAEGRYCREFQGSVTIGGKTEQAYGNACRGPDGSWQIIR